MRRRKAALAACGVISATLMTAGTSQAAAPAPVSPRSATACQIVAWGHALPVVCREHASLNADWTGDGIRDEVFFVSPPNDYVYRISAATGGPVRVSNGAAYAMDHTEIRASGYHRVYAVTAGSTLIYSQLEGSTWTPWYRYVP